MHALMLLALFSCANLVGSSAPDKVMANNKTANRAPDCGLPTYAYPGDAHRHFNDIHARLKRFFPSEPLYWSGYFGPWIENWWIKDLRPDWEQKGSAAFGPYIPLFIPWRDIWHNVQLRGPKTKKMGFSQEFLAELKKVLREDVLYVTLTEMDSGLGGLNGCEWRPPPNLLIFGGSHGHVPIPIIKSAYQLPSNTTKIMSIVFFGRNVTSPTVRGPMCDQITQSSRSLKLPGATRVCEESPHWTELTPRAHIGMAPRGYGRGSYRLTETIQLGTVPWHVWDDVEWVPYQGMYHKFGYSSRVDRVADDLAKVSMEDVRRKREFVLRVRSSHFTFVGVMKQIRRFLADPSKADLRCRPHPICPGREITQLQPRGKCRCPLPCKEVDPADPKLCKTIRPGWPAAKNR